MSEVKNKGDFIQWLGSDMSIKILNRLDDPCDLVRVAAVSRSWYQFVIENDLCKQFFLKMYPELSGVAHTIEVDNMIEPVRCMLDSSLNCKCLERNHKVYAFFACGLTPFMRNNCILEAISASSTDHYPEEGIRNTLEPQDRTAYGPSYWSSKGERDPSVPETLVYKLMAKTCVITEIHVQPFQEYFAHWLHIYSAKAVRFRLGHSRYPMESESALVNNHILEDNEFIWTYFSPEFPMAQENCLQKFKLPEPVLCIGGVLLVELLGRVQKHELDGLFYICISRVQVMGRPLLPTFDVEIHPPSGKCTLKYCPQVDCCMSLTSSSRGARLRTFT